MTDHLKADSAGKCDLCGKFRRWEDLQGQLSMTYSGFQREWFECRVCSPELFYTPHDEWVAG